MSTVSDWNYETMLKYILITVIFYCCYFEPCGVSNNRIKCCIHHAQYIRKIYLPRTVFHVPSAHLTLLQHWNLVPTLFQLYFNVLQLWSKVEYFNIINKHIDWSFFKKWYSLLVTSSWGICSTQIDYIMVRNIDKKAANNIKVVLRDKGSQKHQLLICDLIVYFAVERK